MVHKITPFHSDDTPHADDNNSEAPSNLMSPLPHSAHNHNLPGEVKVLRRAHINRLIDKVRMACQDGEEAETPSGTLQGHRGVGRKKAFALTRAQREALGRKVLHAIRDCYADKGAAEKRSSDDTDKSARLALTTRALLPFYKFDDVKNFMEVFHKVDHDFSGDLGIIDTHNCRMNIQ